MRGASIVVDNLIRLLGHDQHRFFEDKQDMKEGDCISSSMGLGNELHSILDIPSDSLAIKFST